MTGEKKKTRKAENECIVNEQIDKKIEMKCDKKGLPAILGDRNQTDWCYQHHLSREGLNTQESFVSNAPTRVTIWGILVNGNTIKLMNKFVHIVNSVSKENGNDVSYQLWQYIQLFQPKKYFTEMIKKKNFMVQWIFKSGILNSLAFDIMNK